MADSGVGGFMGGVMATGEYQGRQQAYSDEHSQATQQLAKGSLEIQQTQKLLDAQAAAMLALKGHQSSASGGAPGQGGIGGMATQSYNASEMAFAAGDAYMKQGLVDQGNQFMEQGAKLAESGAKLEVHQAEQQSAMWGHIGSVLDSVHEGSPTAAQDWDKARMTFPLMFPEEAKHPEIQKFLSKPYDPQTVDLLKRASITAKEQADLQKTKAETKKAEAGARFEAAGVGLRQAEAKEHSARAAALGKTGAKPPPAAEVNNAKSLIQAEYPEADPKGYQLYATEIAERAKGLMTAGLDRDSAFQQAFQETNDSGKLKNLPAKASKKEADQKQAKNDLVDSIDDLISDMEANPGASGIKGKLGRIGEFAATATGIGDQDTPLTRIVAKAQMVQTQVPKALTGSARSAKDERELTAALSDITKLGTNDPLYITKLKALRNRLAGTPGGDETIKGKGDKTAPAAEYASEAEAAAAAKAGKLKSGTRITINGVSGTWQ